MNPANFAMQIAICDAKVHFRKRGDAMKWADYRASCPQKPYRCPICNEWHLTTQSDSISRYHEASRSHG